MQRKTLDNGIRVIMEQMTGAHSAAIGVWVNAGSIHEQEQDSGISHFIEHMLFKGTKRRSARDIAVEMDAVGGNLNAFTAKECTCYYAKVLDTQLALAVDILSDIVLNSTLTPENIEREKGVVLEEIFMTEDTPEDLVFEVASKAYFEGSSLMRPILGTADTVRSFTRERLRAYMDRHYTAENLVIACAGSFDPDALLALLEQAFGGAGSSRRYPIVEHAPNRGFRELYVKKDIEQVHTCLTFPGFPLGTPDYYALAVLSNAVGGSMSSRMFQKIREDKGLAYAVYTYPMCYRGIGSLCVYAGSGEKQAAEVLSLMLEELADVADRGITDDEFIRCKEQLKGSYLLGMETASAHMNAIGKCLLLEDEEYSVNATISRIECVTIADIDRIIPQVLAADAMTAAAVGRLTGCEKAMRRACGGWWKKHGQA